MRSSTALPTDPNTHRHPTSIHPRIGTNSRNIYIYICVCVFWCANTSSSHVQGDSAWGPTAVFLPVLLLVGQAVGSRLCRSSSVRSPDFLWAPPARPLSLARSDSRPVDRAAAPPSCFVLVVGWTVMVRRRRSPSLGRPPAAAFNIITVILCLPSAIVQCVSVARQRSNNSRNCEDP